MPRLPDSSAFGPRPVPVNRQGVAQQDTTSAGESMARLGQVISQAGEEVAKVDDTQKVFEARRQLDEWERKTLYDPEAGALSKKGKDALGLPAKVNEEFDAFSGKILEGLSGNRQRNAFLEMAAARRNHMADVVVRHAIDQKAVFEKGQLQADIGASEERTKLLTLNGDFLGGFLEQKVIGERIAGFLRDRGASDAEIAQTVAEQARKTNEAAYYSYFDKHGTEAFVNGDASRLSEVRKKLDGEIGENLNPDRRAALQRQFHSWGESIAATDKYRTATKIKDYETAVLNGEGDRIPASMVPTMDDAKVIHPKGEDAATFYQQQIEPLMKIQAGVQAMKSATPEERNAIVAAASPDVAPGYTGAASAQQSLIKAKNLMEQRFLSDPADYVIKNSRRATDAAFIFNRVIQENQITAADTPEQAATKRAEIVAAGRYYGEVMNSEQLRLGVDTIRDERTGNKNKKPRLLTNAEANYIADEFSNGGPKAADMIRAQEIKWGPLWPQVYAQLAQDTKLPPAALVIPNMPDDASRAALAQASSMKPEELKSLVGSTDPKDIQDRLLNKFADAQRTFVSQGTSGNKTLSSVIGEAEKLALLYRSRGDSVNEASDKAFDKVMGWKYIFADTYRIPQDKQQMSASEIRNGANIALNDLVAKGGLTVFAGGQASKEAVTDALKTRTLWVTNADESGLQLMVQGSDGSILAVNGENGRPVQVDWNTLMTNARKPAASTANPEPNRQQQARGAGFGAEVDAARKARDGVSR